MRFERRTDRDGRNSKGPGDRSSRDHRSRGDRPYRPRRHRRHALAILIALLGVSALMVAPTYAAESAGPKLERKAIDSDTCRMINEGLAAAVASGKYAIPSKAKDQIKNLTADGCFVEVGSGDAAAAFGVASAAAATTCDYRNGELHIWSGPIEVATARYDGHWCWNGTRVWNNNYKWCRVTTFFGFFGGVDNCTYINNNTAVLTARMDFWDAAYSAPWWHRYGWMTFTVNKFGTRGPVNGFCCN